MAINFVNLGGKNFNGKDMRKQKEPLMNANERELKNISVHSRVFAVNKGGN